MSESNQVKDPWADVRMASEALLRALPKDANEILGLARRNAKADMMPRWIKLYSIVGWMTGVDSRPYLVEDNGELLAAYIVYPPAPEPPEPDKWEQAVATMLVPNESSFEACCGSAVRNIGAALRDKDKKRRGCIQRLVVAAAYCRQAAECLEKEDQK